MNPLRLHGERPAFGGAQFWGRTPEEAFDDPRLTDADIRVLGTIALLAYSTHPICAASRKRIACKSLKTERGLRYILARLETHGYVALERDEHNRRRIRLLKELRAPFSLEATPRKTRKKRNGHSSPEGNGHSPPRGNGYSSLLFEEREIQDARAAATSVNAHSPPPAASGKSAPDLPGFDWAAWRASGYRPAQKEARGVIRQDPAAGPGASTVDADQLYPEGEIDPTPTPDAVNLDSTDLDRSLLETPDSLLSNCPPQDSNLKPAD